MNQKRKTPKKLLSLLLAVVIMLTVFCCVPLTANAGEIQEGNYYGLYYYANYLNDFNTDDNNYSQDGGKHNCPLVKNCMFNAPDGKKFKCWTNQDVTAFCYPNEVPSNDFLTSFDHPALGAYLFYYGLFALWEDENATTTYTVWFKGDNWSWMEPLKGQIVEKGKKATEPTEPKLHQFYRFEDWFYEFCGWYQDEDYTVPYDFNNPVYDNLIIYLKWRSYPAEEFKGVIASFEANGGSGEQTAIGVDKGEQLTLPECTFTAPENATFAGWQNGSNTYKPGDKIDMTGDMTFNAVWKYPVTINSVSCTVTAPIAGQKPDYTAVPADSEAYTATVSEWIYGTGRTARTMTADEEFIEGKTYQAYVKFTSNDGYTFADDATYTINGKAATKTTIRNTDYYAVTFTCPAKSSIDSVNVTGIVAPVAGQSPSYIATVPDSAGYQVDIAYNEDGMTNGIIWNYEDYDMLFPDDTFTGGESYHATVRLTARDGYAFPVPANGHTYQSGELPCTINTENAVVTYFSENVIQVTRTFTCRSSAMIGDTNLDGRITISDVTAIQRHIAELDIFTDEQIALADTNGDGVINITDATHLQKYLAEFDGIVLGNQPTA